MGASRRFLRVRKSLNDLKDFAESSERKSLARGIIKEPCCLTFVRNWAMTKVSRREMFKVGKNVMNENNFDATQKFWEE